MRLGGTFAALVLLFIAASGQQRVAARTSEARSPHPGLDFSIEVAGATGCDTRSGDATCALTPGRPFTVNVDLGPLPSDIPSYAGFDIVLSYAGVTPLGQPNPAIWPGCVFVAVAPPEVGRVAFGCAYGGPITNQPPSTYTGVIGTAQFTCTQAGSIVLRNGHGGTDLVEDGARVYFDPTPAETLNITCLGPALARFADANCDGLVDSLDALLILQWDTHLLDHLPCPEAADANADGAVDAVDAALVLQASAALVEMPPPPTTPTLTPTPTIATTPAATPAPSPTLPSQ